MKRSRDTYIHTCIHLMCIFYPLREALLSHGAHTKKLHSGRAPTSISHDLDQALLAHIQSAKVNSGPGATLLDKDLQAVARECARRLGVTGFKASSSWLRGWKERCLGEGSGRRQERKKSASESETGPNKCVSGSHGNTCSKTTPPSSEQLSMLTEDEKRGVASIDPGAGVVSESEGYARTEDPPNKDCLPGNRDTPTSSSQGSPAPRQATPLSHDSPATPAPSLGEFNLLDTFQSRDPARVSRSDGSHQSHDPALESHDPALQSHDPALQSHNPALQSHDPALQSHDPALQSHDPALQSHDPALQSHDPALKSQVLDSITKELCDPDNVLLSLSNDQLTQQEFPTPADPIHSVFADHTHSDEFATSPLLGVEEDQLISSVFNHRSFTDHFPFLPPTLFSNWCPPYDSPHMQNNSSQTTPTFDGPNCLKRSMVLSPSCTHGKGVRPGVNYQVQTRSMARAKAAAASVHTGPSVATLPGPSPLDTSSPPPGLGGVSLLSSPSGSGGLVSSPPAGGLLANRLSQPTFLDEPEIIFHEIQLGPLHTTPLMPVTIATTASQLM